MAKMDESSAGSEATINGPSVRERVSLLFKKNFENECLPLSQLPNSLRQPGAGTTGSDDANDSDSVQFTTVPTYQPESFVFGLFGTRAAEQPRLSKLWLGFNGLLVIEDTGD